MTFDEMAILAKSDTTMVSHLIRCSERFVRICVKRWGGGLEMDEAWQVARIAMLSALRTFDPGKATWSTHARIRIRAELQRARSRQYCVSGLCRRGREDSEIREIARHPCSLDADVGNGDTFADLYVCDGLSPEDLVIAADDARRASDTVDRLANLVHLKPRHKAILLAIIGHGIPQVTIAAREGISRQRVKQLEVYALRRMAKAVRREALFVG